MALPKINFEPMEVEDTITSNLRLSHVTPEAFNKLIKALDYKGFTSPYLDKVPDKDAENSEPVVPVFKHRTYSLVVPVFKHWNYSLVTEVDQDFVDTTGRKSVAVSLFVSTYSSGTVMIMITLNLAQDPILRRELGVSEFIVTPMVARAGLTILGNVLGGLYNDLQEISFEERLQGGYNIEDD